MDFVFSYTIIGPFLLSLHFYFVNWTPIVACAEQAYARWKQRFVSFILFYSFHPLFVFTLDNRFFLLLYGNVSSYMNIYAFILSTRKRWIKAVQTKDYQFSRSYTYSADKLFHPFFFLRSFELTRISSNRIERVATTKHKICIHFIRQRLCLRVRVVEMKTKLREKEEKQKSSIKMANHCCNCHR